MGDKLLQAHVQALRSKLEALPASAQLLKLGNVEDNVLEFKVLLDDSNVKEKRLKFLIYESDVYPNSGGAIMSDDDEALVERINEQLEDVSPLFVSRALREALVAMGTKESALLACLACQTDCLQTGAEGKSEDEDAGEDEDFEFEGEDPEEADFTKYTQVPMDDRESRPGWKKMQWQEAENQRLARRSNEQQQAQSLATKRQKVCGTDLSLEEEKAAKEQMWSSTEAFSILSNELFSLQTEAVQGIEADAVKFNVHCWDVKLRGCQGALGQDLQELQRCFGYDYIQLHIAFKEDLHPFYPPTVTIVRPRLIGKHDILAAMAYHPRLQLKGWSPFQTTKEVISAIRNFLERIARVDLQNQQNDLGFAEGAFSPLEQKLVQLGRLREIVPSDLRQDSPGNVYEQDSWMQNKLLQETCLGAMLQRKKQTLEQRAQSSAGSGWAAGTGYGSNAEQRVHGTWDPQAMTAAQEAQDEEVQQLVQGIRCSIASAASSSRSSNKSSSSRACPGSEPPTDSDPSALADLLSKSCLPLFLARELAMSYTNMGDRLVFFEEVFRLVQEILHALPCEEAASLLDLSRQGLRTAKAAAQNFLSWLGSQSDGGSSMSNDIAFARLVISVADEADKLCGSREAGNTATSVSGGSDEAAYCRCLQPLQLDSSDVDFNVEYLNLAQQETAAPQARTVRLAKELAGIGSLLPLSSSSSVHVRISSQRQQLWRALITGPDETPYSGGCFIFEFYFPVRYPAEPPKVKILTTGRGTVTFNPNLYSNGKVCLSLLGTWQGEKAENWDAVNSRAVQVLISIQSLILVPQPYFNEPGYERQIGTSFGDARSRSYNEAVRENCIRWAMIEQLRRPSPEFAEVIRLHFKLRCAQVKETIGTWINEAETHRSSDHKARLVCLLADLEKEFKKLPEH
eukprot:TRINITY_DN73243_c0_g1_i1.p1 TRINITY_DN73243_c0_g1~~TRINITY_DN73243_c0_g1_i1.p1  ORF type:complete len:928 (-),score=204.20 TRINITY_DN73243_c0_g1_i1:467-3199(-)